MKCCAIYTIRHIQPAEQRLIQENLLGMNQRILAQQFCDGFPTFRHYGLLLSDGSVVHFRGRREHIHINAWIQRTSLAEFCQGGRIYPACEEMCIRDSSRGRESSTIIRPFIIVQRKGV